MELHAKGPHLFQVDLEEGSLGKLLALLPAIGCLMQQRGLLCQPVAAELPLANRLGALLAEKCCVQVQGLELANGEPESTDSAALELSMSGA